MILYFSQCYIQISLQNSTYLHLFFSDNQNLPLHVASQNNYAKIQYTSNILICLIFQQLLHHKLCSMSLRVKSITLLWRNMEMHYWQRFVNEVCLQQLCKASYFSVYQLTYLSVHLSIHCSHETNLTMNEWIFVTVYIWEFC